MTRFRVKKASTGLQRALRSLLEPDQLVIGAERTIDFHCGSRHAVHGFRVDDGEDAQGFLRQPLLHSDRFRAVRPAIADGQGPVVLRKIGSGSATSNDVSSWIIAYSHCEKSHDMGTLSKTVCPAVALTVAVPLPIMDPRLSIIVTAMFHSPSLTLLKVPFA